MAASSRIAEADAYCEFMPSQARRLNRLRRQALLEDVLERFVVSRNEDRWRVGDVDHVRRGPAP